ASRRSARCWRAKASSSTARKWTWRTASLSTHLADPPVERRDLVVAGQIQLHFAFLRRDVKKVGQRARFLGRDPPRDVIKARDVAHHIPHEQVLRRRRLLREIALEQTAPPAHLRKKKGHRHQIQRISE